MGVRRTAAAAAMLFALFAGMLPASASTTPDRPAADPLDCLDDWPWGQDLLPLECLGVRLADQERTVGRHLA